MLQISKTDERLLDLKDLSYAEVDEIENALKVYNTVKASGTSRRLLTKLLTDKKNMKRD